MKGVYVIWIGLMTIVFGYDLNQSNDDAKKSKHDCSIDIMNAECLNNTFPSMPKLFNKYEDDSDTDSIIQKFKKLNQEEKNEIITKQYDKSIQEKALSKGKVQNSIVLFVYYSLQDCNTYSIFSSCRNIRMEHINVLLSDYITIFKKKTLIENIKEINKDKPTESIISLGKLMFYISLIGNGFNMDSYNHLINLNEIIFKEKDNLIDMIEKDTSLSSLVDFKDNAQKDLIELLLLIQINIIQVNSFLEADKLYIKNDTNQFIDSESLNSLANNIEIIMPILPSLKIQSISYDYFHLLFIDNRITTNSSTLTTNVIVHYNYQKSFNNDVDLIAFFVMEKFPFISLNTSDFYRKSYSVRQYKKNDNAYIRISILQKLESISFEIEMKNDTKNLTEPYIYVEKVKEFVCKNGKLNKTQTNDIISTTLSMAVQGDYTIGKPLNPAFLWLLIGLSVLSVIVISGLGYLLYSLIQKRQTKTIENDIGNEPLIQEQSSK